MTSVGIFTGTFDPIHQGHIAFCRATLEQCGFEKVYIIPEREPRRKQNVRSLDRRLQALRKALAAIDRTEVTTLDEPRFTIKDSLPKLKHLAGPAEPTLMLGSDVARTLKDWDGIAELIGSMPIAIALRRYDTPEEIKKIMQALQKRIGVTPRYTIIDTTNRFMASSYLQRIGQAVCREVVDFSA